MINRLFRNIIPPTDTDSPSHRLEDEESFRQSLEGKSETELWDLRNEYHAKLVEANGTEDYAYYLDCIGVIDSQIGYLRKQGTKAS